MLQLVASAKIDQWPALLCLYLARKQISTSDTSGPLVAKFSLVHFQLLAPVALGFGFHFSFGPTLALLQNSAKLAPLKPSGSRRLDDWLAAVSGEPARACKCVGWLPDWLAA